MFNVELTYDLYVAAVFDSTILLSVSMHAPNCDVLVFMCELHSQYLRYKHILILRKIII